MISPSTAASTSSAATTASTSEAATVSSASKPLRIRIAWGALRESMRYLILADVELVRDLKHGAEVSCLRVWILPDLAILWQHPIAVIIDRCSCFEVFTNHQCSVREILVDPQPTAINRPSVVSGRGLLGHLRVRITKHERLVKCEASRYREPLSIVLQLEWPLAIEFHCGRDANQLQEVLVRKTFVKSKEVSGLVGDR